MLWNMRPFSADKAAYLSRELGLSTIVAGVLVARGITDPAGARAFINPSLEDAWSAPDAITGMREVAERLERAILDEKRIAIFGDYDVDGITAAAIMYLTLQTLGARAEVLLPLREGEGYGLSDAALERILVLEPDVVLTVDCGVSGAKEVSQLLKHGIEVLITDHHEASEDVPSQVPLADPKLDPESPAAILAGAGVALKLAALLGARLEAPDLWKEVLDLATLGTIADVMPLTGENRVLVSAGIKLLKQGLRPGLAALQEVSGRTDAVSSSEALAYGLIPRLNAAGRVSDPMIAFDLLCTRDPLKAHRLAGKLEALNKERKELEAILYAEAVKQIEPFPEKQRSIIVGGEGWHDGVKGIVANRLAREYGVPALVFSFEDGYATGSGRSVGTLDLHAAVGSLSDMLLRFGGHQAAVGLMLEQNQLQEFARQFERIMQEAPQDQFEQVDTIDCEIGFDRLSLSAVDDLALLEPFGKENPEPRFLTRKLMLKAPQFVGSGQQHLSLTLSDGMHECKAIWFNAQVRSLESLPAFADVIYRVQIDEWRGRRNIKLFIMDLIACDPHESGDTGFEIRDSQQQLENLLFLGTETALTAHLASSITGHDVVLRAAQSKCLDTLRQGKSTLAIMATGRGKSLIFHTHAAKLALQHKKPSLFIYPLRSLISDQEYFLAQALERIGLSCASLTGSTTDGERLSIANRIREGSLHIILSTPEFVLANAQVYDFWSDFGFVVVDEAHHIATSGREFRPDYTCLSRVRALAPHAVFLGLSATSDKAVTDTIASCLSIDQIVIDTTKRLNLALQDERNAHNRDQQLTEIVERSTKALVYTSSRGATIELCKKLRKSLRNKASRIAFYHAGLTPGDRRIVEESYRMGVLDCLIATSAFGEGVNIPDVRDVVLYDLPFSLIDFNQMAGRAGRDGAEANIHVMAHATDAESLFEYLKNSEGDLPVSVETPEVLNEREESIRHLQMFADWLFTTSSHDLLSVIQKPLTPLEEHGLSEREARQ